MPVAQQYPTFQPYESFAPTDPNAMAKTSHDILAGAVPGLDNLNRSASSGVSNLLNGMPNPGVAQRANAYFGVNSGIPSSDYVRNRGVDLYGRQADQYKQRGFDDFLSLLRGASGTIAPTTGEQAQAQAQNQSLQQQTTQNNSQIARNNNQSAMQLRDEADRQWKADKYSGFKTTDTLGLSPLFGYGSGLN